MMLSVKAKLWVNKMIIYKVRNKINNKIYIGQTVNTLDVRRSQHERSYDYGKRTAFSNAIHKYGKENFEWEIIYEADSISELNEKETYYIEKYNSLVTQNGYNLKGGGGNDFLTDEVKKKISVAQIGEKNHMYGKTGVLNPTSKKVINLTTNMIFGSASEAAQYDKTNFSHVCSVCRGTRGSTKGNVYRYLDKENNILQPENSAKVKAKKVRNLDTGEIFENATKAEFHYQGYKSGNLSKACTGKNKTFAGFRWEYI